MAEHKTVAVDLDGVLAYYVGWNGPTPGKPIEGSLQAMQELKRMGWKIIIFTSRGEKYVKLWLDTNGYPYDAINENPDSGFEGPKEYISHKKPYFTVMVDDRCVQFTGSWRDCLKRVLEFIPWWDGRRSFKYAAHEVFVRELKKFALSRGYISYAVLKKDNALLSSALSRYGSVRKACEDNGIVFKTNRMKDSEILAALRVVSRKYSCAISKALLLIEGRRLLNACIYHFGSLKDACKAAGVLYCRKNDMQGLFLYWLGKKLNVVIEREVVFPWLINSKTGCFLRFDGFIRELNVALEIDGESHRNEFYFSYCKKDYKEYFMDIKFRDSIKDRLAAENGIRLVRIPFPITIGEACERFNKFMCDCKSAEQRKALGRVKS